MTRPVRYVTPIPCESVELRDAEDVRQERARQDASAYVWLGVLLAGILILVLW